MSFQNLIGARARLQRLFGFDISARLSSEQWQFVCRCFQKRHLLAHKMGIIDEQYVQVTTDPAAVVGRKVQIRPQEVIELTQVLKLLGVHLRDSLTATAMKS